VVAFVAVALLSLMAFQTVAESNIWAGKVINKVFVVTAGIDRIRFVKTGTAPEPTATQALAYNKSRDSFGDLRCYGVRIEGKVPFYWKAYLANGDSLVGGPADGYAVQTLCGRM